MSVTRQFITDVHQRGDTSSDPEPDVRAEPTDYGRFDRGRGDALNYWTLDPTLRSEARRVYPEGEFEWAEPLLEEFGDAVAGPIAANAEEIDRRGIDLDTYDRDGEVVNRVRYPAELEETERLAYERFRLTHDAFHAPPGREEAASLVHRRRCRRCSRTTTPASSVRRHRALRERRPRGAR